MPFSVGTGEVSGLGVELHRRRRRSKSCEAYGRRRVYTEGPCVVFFELF